MISSTFGYNRKKKNSSKKYTGTSGPDKNTSIIVRQECQIFRRHLTQQTSRLPRVWWIFGGTHTLEHQPLWRILHPLRQSDRLIISCFSLLLLTPPLGGRKNVFFFSFFLSFVYCSTAGYTTFRAGYTTYKCDEGPCNEWGEKLSGRWQQQVLFVRSFRSLKKRKRNLRCHIIMKILYMGYY